METVEEIVPDDELNKAWANANFGNVERRDVVKGVLLKCASGYYTGHTAKSIVSELGLVTPSWKLTKRGKRYLFAAYSGGVSI